MKYVTVIGEGMNKLVESTANLTVGELKEIIHQETGISADKQRLICGSDLLSDDSKLVFSYSHLRGRFGHILLEHTDRTVSEFAERMKQYTSVPLQLSTNI